MMKLLYKMKINGIKLYIGEDNHCLSLDRDGE